MTERLAADHPLLIEVIESHQDRLRVMDLVNDERDELRAENEQLRESRQRYMDIATGISQVDFIEKDNEIKRLQAALVKHHKHDFVAAVPGTDCWCQTCGTIWQT